MVKSPRSRSTVSAFAASAMDVEAKKEQLPSAQLARVAAWSPRCKCSDRACTARAQALAMIVEAKEKLLTISTSARHAMERRSKKKLKSSRLKLTRDHLMANITPSMVRLTSTLAKSPAMLS